MSVDLSNNAPSINKRDSKSAEESVAEKTAENDEDKENSIELNEENNGITNEKLKKIAEQLGIIFTSFPENKSPEFEGQTKFPITYHTLSPKEKLLLLFGENFRRQFSEKYSNRKPQVLAVSNECGIQKFVSTSIRPTAFLYSELIGSWKECAKLVADYITYEPLLNPISMPDRLISPDTLLKRRKGNCFEMATLLCSLLIGTGFAACVVSGYATREITLNDQRRVECPNIPKTKKEKTESELDVEQPNKYKLRESPDFRSKFLLELEQHKIDKAISAEKKREEDEQRRIEELEQLPPDEFIGCRVHSWIAIIKNAVWSYLPDDKLQSPQSDDEPPIEPTAFFIEPSTGFQFDINNPNYLGIESVWNQYNYYVNRQEPIRDIPNMRWNFGLTDDWEHLLPAEPFELRVDRPLSAEVECLTAEEEISKEKHLDMPNSWVEQLHIGLPDFEERFPNGEKMIHYKKCVFERFAPYKKKDGLIKRLTLFETLNYENPLKKWEWYTNREDLLEMIKIDFKTKQIEETIVKGRTDALKYFSHNTEALQEKIFKFYCAPRFDALKELHVQRLYIKEHYDKRDDLLYYREFRVHPGVVDYFDPKKIIQVTEKFHRNPKIQAIRDIATRHFFLNDAKIFIKYHYDDDCVTAATREFIKPPKPEFGKEVIYDPEETSGYISNPSDPQPTDLDLYMLLLEQLNAESKVMKAFDLRYSEISDILSNRKMQMQSPKLTFSIFDPLRNQAARRIRLEKYEKMKEREEFAKKQPADFLAPYLIYYEKRKPTQQESVAAFKNCLTDLRNFYLQMLNELQRRYDELTTESKSLKRFLLKFQDQFDDFDYDKLIKEGEIVESNKRMVQQRLMNLQEEAQKKFDQVKMSLINDPRLTLITDENNLEIINEN